MKNKIMPEKSCQAFFYIFRREQLLFQMTFKIDERIESGSIFLIDGRLSSVYLKNEAAFPWLILVPRVPDIQELYQLTAVQQGELMTEITQVSQLMKTYFQPDKINVGALGNIVSQLHVHVVARFKEDLAWPQSIWQAGLASFPYAEEAACQLIHDLRKLL